MPIKVLLVNDDAATRVNLARVLAAYPDLRVLGEGVRSRMGPLEEEPDVVLVWISDGQLAGAVGQRFPDCPLIAMVSVLQPRLWVGLKAAASLDCLTPVAELVETIRRVAAHRPHASSAGGGPLCVFPAEERYGFPPSPPGPLPSLE